MKILNVITSAYRAVLEEQDDTILWLSQAMANAGGEIDILLRGAAVNYLLLGQDASGLAIGTWKQTCPPALTRDLDRLMASRRTVYAVADDIRARGLAGQPIVAGAVCIARDSVPKLMSDYQRVFFW
jgi:hypothetical protein